MNVDKLFDKLESNPVKTLVGLWALGAVMSLIGLVITILVIVGVLNLVGVL